MKIAEPNQMIRQGDVLLIPRELPADAVIQQDRVGIKIEGERTGHAHQLVGAVAVVERAAGRVEFVRGGNVLTHEEHEHIASVPQWYEVRIQREFVPQQSPQRRRD